MVEAHERVKHSEEWAEATEIRVQDRQAALAAKKDEKQPVPKVPGVNRCRLCSSVGHNARTCPKRICLHCKNQGHEYDDCPKRVGKQAPARVSTNPFHADPPPLALPLPPIVVQPRVLTVSAHVEKLLPPPVVEEPVRRLEIPVNDLPAPLALVSPLKPAGRAEAPARAERLAQEAKALIDTLLEEKAEVKAEIERHVLRLTEINKALSSLSALGASIPLADYSEFEDSHAGGAGGSSTG